MAVRDLYEVLGVSRSASAEEVKRAYRRLAKQHHPDRNSGDAGAEGRFKEVQQAYAILSDPKRRAQYDQTGHAGPLPEGGEWAGGPGGARVYRWTSGQGGPVDFDMSDLADLFDFGGRDAESIFGSFFAGRGDGKRRSTGGARGRAGAAHRTEASESADIEQDAELTFDEALHGTTLELTVRGGGRSETIQVRVPPGVRDGQRIRVRGKGGAIAGGRRGDIYLRCRVQPHAHFRREENDLFLDLPVTITEAALGAKVDVPTPGGRATVTIPAGSSSGTRLRLAGHGVPGSGARERGDLYCVVKVVAPKSLTARQRELLEELERTRLSNPREGRW